MLSGVFGLISGIFLVAFLPLRDRNVEGKLQEQSQQQRTKGRHFQIKKSDIGKVLFDKSLFAFGLVLLGAQIAWGLPLTFIVFYLEDYVRVDSSTAGLIAGLGLISGVVSAPVFGRIYDKTKNVKNLLFVCGVAMSAGVAGIAITTATSLSSVGLHSWNLKYFDRSLLSCSSHYSIYCS